MDRLEITGLTSAYIHRGTGNGASGLYPGLAILCFTAAAAGSFWLVIGIFVHNYQTRRKYPR